MKSDTALAVAPLGLQDLLVAKPGLAAAAAAAGAAAGANRATPNVAAANAAT